MLKVKVFDEQHEEDLSESINRFLTLIEEKQLVDIRFSTSSFSQEEEQIYSFSALVLYRIDS